MNRLVIIVLVVLVVAINALYDGKIAEFIGNALHTWQTSETVVERTASDQRRQRLEKQYGGVAACPALKDFARDVGKERVAWRGIWAEVLLENVKATSNRDLLSEYLAAFEKLAFKDSREFDEELRRIVRRYCSRSAGNDEGIGG